MHAVVCLTVTCVQTVAPTQIKDSSLHGVTMLSTGPAVCKVVFGVTTKRFATNFGHAIRSFDIRWATRHMFSFILLQTQPTQPTASTRCSSSNTEQNKSGILYFYSPVPARITGCRRKKCGNSRTLHIPTPAAEPFGPRKTMLHSS